MMRNALLSLVALLLALTAQATVRYSSFTLQSPNGQVIIEWTTATEAGCSSFVLERSVDGIQFYDIATFSPHGEGIAYRYIDSDVFKQSTRTFYYRVRAQVADRQVMSETKSIAVIISGIQQTWGSLKAMFR